jgi:ATP-binding cassette subfamily F protein uup
VTILLSCRDLSKRFGSRPLFEGLTFGLDDGERTGLIGPNGAGKSTLLKILAGLEKSDSGELAVRRGLRVHYLAQTDAFVGAAEGGTIREELIHTLEDAGLEEWEVEIRVDTGIARAGFVADQRVAALSGGGRKRLAIVAQALREPDLLLLDEPTNHLDIEGVLWLEGFLAGVSFPFVVVTHDRRFLETVCNRIIELNPRYPGGHFSCPGNYSRFVEAREALFAAENAREESQRNIVRREIEWLRKGPRARTTKQKARIDRAGGLIDDLAELSHRNAQDRTARIDFTGSERKTRRLVETIGVEKSLGGRKLFGPLDLELGPGDKLGLLGANGSGKSTLLGILAGTLEPDTGSTRRADRLQVATFDQQREELDLSLTLKRALCERGEFVEYRGKPVHINGWAARFLFHSSQLEMPLAKLSGGEQARVLIARLMLKPADLLLLDEPTNDLDIGSLKVLETNLLEFPGALVLVTHDRFLLDRVSRQILALDGRGNATFHADLDQWESAEAERTATKASPAQPPCKPAPEKALAARPALTYLETKELKSIEGRIQTAEIARARAAEALADPSIATDADELIARQAVLAEAETAVEALYRRWEELEAKR